MRTLELVLTHIHNFFPVESKQGSAISISDGVLVTTLPLREGCWYRIQGSLLNDGLHQHPDPNLHDETFDGTVTLCAIPNALLDVVDEIDEWIEDTREADRAARRAKFASESFGGYSYTTKDDSRSNAASGGLTGWQAAFAAELSPWRRMY